MLAGQGEESPDGRGPGLPQRAEQPLDHGLEHLLGVQPERRLGQPGVAPVEERGAQAFEPPGRAAQERRDHQLGVRPDPGPGQFVEVFLDRECRAFLLHN